MQKTRIVSGFYQSSFLLIFLILAWLGSFGQEKNLVQVKTFDQQLKAFKNVDLSINGQDFIHIGDKGEAFTELSADELPVKSVRIRNEQLEAASWNYSKGVIQIIIRKKNYEVHHFTLRRPDNATLASTHITFKGKKQLSLVTDKEGKFEIALSLDETIESHEQFAVDNYRMLKLERSGQQNILLAQPVISEAVRQSNAVVASKSEKESGYFKDFDLSKLDSIQSLTVFYAIFKDYQFKNMSEAAKAKVDAKFNQLVRQLEDSLRRNELAFIGRISDSSFVNDDIKNLLEQTMLESQMLQFQRADFDEKIALINEKLAAGVANLDAATRSKLLADITRLEQLLVENENRFYRNHNDYRSIVNSLKEKYFEFEDLENKLSVSEAQRLQEQRLFRQRLLIILGVAFVFANMIVLLIYFSNKLRKQKKALEVANQEIKRINENLEALVYERTRELEEAHKELDTFLYRASHDLRSPVCSIIGLCNLASHFSGEEARDILDKVVATTGSMDRLLKKLTIISEINQPTEFSSITLNELVERVSYNVKEIREKRIRFAFDCADDLTIQSHPHLMEAILTNLVENAVCYATMKNGDEGLVSLTIAVSDNMLELAVYDNGIGIDPKIREKIYNMFYKGHVQSKGNGLGLYIVQKSVHALGGEVTLETEAGAYTKFVVTVPLRTAPVKRLREGIFAFN